MAEQDREQKMAEREEMRKQRKAESAARQAEYDALSPTKKKNLAKKALEARKEQILQRIEKMKQDVKDIDEQLA